MRGAAGVSVDIILNIIINVHSKESVKKEKNLRTFDNIDKF